MKKYLAVFVAPIEAYDTMKEQMKNQTPEEQKKNMDAWMQWMEKHKADIADPGAPVGSAKRLNHDGSVSDMRNTIGGYMVVQANSHEDAIKIFEDSPHSAVEGGGIEVMEMMKM